MHRSAAIDEAIAGLMESEAGFDAIERDLGLLKLRLLANSPEVLEPIQDCSGQILEHERGVNKYLSHFNKTLSNQKAPSSLVIGGDAAIDVFEALDDLISRHLSTLGYASVAEAIRHSSGHPAQDSPAQDYVVEAFIEHSMHQITCGEYGGPPTALEGATKAPATPEPGRGRPHARSRSSLEGPLGSLGLSLAESGLGARPAGAGKESEELFSSTSEFRRRKHLEYVFLKHLCAGTSDALQFLQTAASRAELGADQVAALAGRLVTTDTESAREELARFLLELRSELLVLAHGSSDIRTDLDTLISVSKTVLEEHSVALQSIEWDPTSELPFELDLPAAQRFHQIIVCPVTKEQIRPDELKVLPCQHIISRSAMRELITELYDLKCPYCGVSSVGYHIKNGYLVDSLVAHSSRARLVAEEP